MSIETSGWCRECRRTHSWPGVENRCPPRLTWGLGDFISSAVYAVYIAFCIGLAFLALTACSARPDYVSARGATYYFQSAHWQPEQIEAQESHFVEHVPAPWLPRQAAIAVGRTTVFVVPDTFACMGSPTGRCSEEELSDALTVADRGCPFNSALTHGIAHVMQGHAGVYDPQHTDLELWRVADSAAGTCQ